MQISHLIFSKYDHEIMEITNSEGDTPLNWTLRPTNESTIPNEGHYLIKAQKILDDGERGCWMDISTPEMISDHVFTIDAKNGTLIVNDYHALADRVIPAKVSEVFTNYEFYYSTIRPEVGVGILTREIEHTAQKGFICEYLGYIFRDENNVGRALEWFQKSLEYGEPSSEYIFLEIAQLYEQLGQADAAKKYRGKFA